MDLTNPQDLRLAMKLAGIAPRKGLGQHFLIDGTSLDAMVAAGEVGPNDTVLEVGPGLGVMTTRLTALAGQVVAVEADRVFAELLQRDPPANLQVVEADIMKFNLSSLPEQYKVVANIPYYLTSALIRLLLESPHPPALMALLIQREVAERIVAKPGKMSILALSVQYYAEAEMLQSVERQMFWPAPNVDSAILRLRRRPQPAFEADTAKLFRLIKAGFGEKRKQLKNSLAGGLNASFDIIGGVMTAAKIAPTARAQELSLADWGRLYAQAEKLQLL
jgi:16S rRNA (adenine1518-N6/adenine1519-N6)-dimethyltransferase